MKKLLIFTFLIIISFSFFIMKKTPSENEVVFWTLQLGTFDNYMNGVIADFEKENPDIKIKWIDVPYSEGEKRTLASILSNTPPDLVNLTPDFSSVLAQKQALSFINCSELSAYNSNIINALKYDGKCYAVPFYATSSITLFNKIYTDSAPKSYNELFKSAPNIYKKSGVFVTMPTLTENDTMLKLLNKYNAASPQKLTSQESVWLFNQFKSLYQNNYVPKESITQTHREALEKYMSGQIVFIQSGANFLNIVKENAPEIYKHTDVSNQLVGKTGKYDVSIMNLVIPEKALHKDAALKFALFLTNKNNQIEMAKLTTILPANNDALKDKFFLNYNNNDMIAKARCLSAAQLNNLNSQILIKNNQKDILNIINIAVQEVMLDKAPTYKILKNAQTKWVEMEK